MYKYSHGGDIYAPEFAGGKLKHDFSVNINPLGLPAGIKKAMRQSFALCVNYPDVMCGKLAEAVAEHAAVKREHIFFGNGAADVLFRLALALRPKKALLLAPTFSDYEKSLRTVDCRIEYYALKSENGFMVQEDILGCIGQNIDIVYICNPNNPTGRLCEPALLERLLERCGKAGARLLIDECFMDFVDEDKAYSMKKLLEDYDNLIILKAFTKTYAMPGIRLGYCLSSDEDLLTKMYESGQDWNVSVLAQAAGIAALRERDYLLKAKKMIARERRYMLRELAALGFAPMGEANYIFFRSPGKLNLYAGLKDAGYLIRSCGDYRGLGEDFYRIAVKRPTANRGLLKVIKDIVRNEGIAGIN